MTTIKSYTSLEQSKKLAEILPLESADMHYCLEKRDVATGYEISIVPFIQARRFKGKCNIVDIQPVWSLAALLDVLPYPHIEQNYKGKWTCRVELGNTTYLWEESNPIDACVAMIEKLNELNLL